MSETLLPILSNRAVLERTSDATRRVLEDRARPTDPALRYLSPELYATLQQVVAAVLPQDAIGTDVDIAASIDERLRKGTNAGWRFADLPSDGEAYRQGLSVFAMMLEQTPMKHFERMPPPAREGYLRCVAKGDVDGPAQFPLSRWLSMLRTDVVKAWLSHPSTMEKLEIYSFADGRTGATDGPTESEGWQATTPNRSLSFEQGVSASAASVTERGA
ncbi:gluconate 2-dehydrogenase subunit 3 family protein [Terriglobus roseus]|uniref:Gluconate 2-dehydrogenase subunit 3 n=1 Tax=Terriglobus roseus TaxID=392734 RepID=A0A1H4QYF9_9BACT|nr:gluconate 2-dehydrogenase subunit 3 family protein [Terriglobus roseus]SEC24719.1 Gluconate 2-dehydrogenase subunit 3 [Terriglobus roseus]